MDYQTIEDQQQANINQGQQDYQSDVSNANQYQQQYNQYMATAGDEQKKISDYANYLKGAGSGANVYAQQLRAAQKNASYDPNRMAAAQQDALRQSSAMNALQQQQNTPGGYYSGGLSAGQNAALMQSQLAPVQQGVQNANTVLGQENTALQNALSQAQTGTGAQLQTQSQVQSQLKDSFDAANTQAQNAQKQMQYYDSLAQSQQGLNASQQQAFFNARQAYQAAQQAIAQINYLNTQTEALKQGIDAAKTPNNNGTLLPGVSLVPNTTNKRPSQSFTKNATGWTREGLNWLKGKGFGF